MNNSMQQGRKSVYSVTQVNTYIKNMFVQDYLLRNILVKGEISNCKYHTSGHIYFTLKDEGGTLGAVMFSSYRKGLSFRLEEGQKVIVGGQISVYERDGKYQLYAQSVILDGVGDLYQRFEQLKNQLEEMGMFAAEYKQPIPKYSLQIGIVTAPTGAAIQDMIQISGRRNPFVQLYLYPALVQGDGAADSIVRGIKTLDAMGLDCLIVGRGGGSIEDLWAFNEEKVAYAIFNCHTPVISAVGHETDFTIADFVADLRAPTPSAAAELAVFDARQFLADLADYSRRLSSLAEQKAQRCRSDVKALELKLNLLAPERQLAQKRQFLADGQTRLEYLMEARLKDARHRLSLAAARLSGASPLNRLSGGYAYVTGEDERAVHRVEELSEGETVSLRFCDGRAQARIMKVEKDDE